MKRLFLNLALFVVVAQAANHEIKPDKYLAHIKYLASDELKGRLPARPSSKRQRPTSLINSTLLA